MNPYEKMIDILKQQIEILLQKQLDKISVIDFHTGKIVGIDMSITEQVLERIRLLSLFIRQSKEYEERKKGPWLDKVETEIKKNWDTAVTKNWLKEGDGLTKFPFSSLLEDFLGYTGKPGLGQKYFMPLIEDIRVGYECECDTHSSLGWIKVMVADYHFKTKVPEGYTAISIFNISERLKQDGLRVPYLTKEQIEKEGWILKSMYSNSNNFCFTKVINERSWLEVWYNKENKQLEIVKVRVRTQNDDHKRKEVEKEDVLFNGQARDLNEFRTICKLLNLQ